MASKRYYREFQFFWKHTTRYIFVVYDWVACGRFCYFFVTLGPVIQLVFVLAEFCHGIQAQHWRDSLKRKLFR